jgi:hypothetical protein
MHQPSLTVGLLPRSLLPRTIVLIDLRNLCNLRMSLRLRLLSSLPGCTTMPPKPR